LHLTQPIDLRNTLAKNEGERKRFRATFVRTGKKTNFKGYAEDTILLQHITDVSTNQVVTDHVWFTYSKVFDEASLREGDTIEFDARVKGYKKGYVNKALKIDNRKTDFRLSHPTKVIKVQGQKSGV
jgi:hypothetical protein